MQHGVGRCCTVCHSDAKSRTRTRCELLTLLPPLDLLDLVHHTLEDVAFVWLHAKAGEVTHVGRQQLSQLINVAALQLPAPLLPAAETQTKQTVTQQAQTNAFQDYKVQKNLKRKEKKTSVLEV